MQYLHYKEIDSTNSYLKRNYENLGDYTFVTADFQSQGHGRMGRPWKGNPNENLMFSFLIKDKDIISQYASLSILSGVVILKWLEKIGLTDVTVKWPNDVYVHGQKICGILLEGVAYSDEMKAIIVGIGVNVNQTTFPTDYARKATSIYLHTHQKTDVDTAREYLYHTFHDELLSLKEGTNDFLAVARKKNYLKNKEMYCELNGEITKITVLDINDDCSLKAVKDGKEIDISSGEVTFHL